jgi:hypothetical protein
LWNPNLSAGRTGAHPIGQKDKLGGKQKKAKNTLHLSEVTLVVFNVAIVSINNYTCG